MNVLSICTLTEHSQLERPLVHIYQKKKIAPKIAKTNCKLDFYNTQTEHKY
jgi:hypothetical protein